MPPTAAEQEKRKTAPSGSRSKRNRQPANPESGADDDEEEDQQENNDDDERNASADDAEEAALLKRIEALERRKRLKELRERAAALEREIAGKPAKSAPKPSKPAKKKARLSISGSGLTKSQREVHELSSEDAEEEGETGGAFLAADEEAEGDENAVIIDIPGAITKWALYLETSDKLSVRNKDELRRLLAKLRIAENMQNPADAQQLARDVTADCCYIRNVTEVGQNVANAYRELTEEEDTASTGQVDRAVLQRAIRHANATSKANPRHGSGGGGTNNSSSRRQSGNGQPQGQQRQYQSQNKTWTREGKFRGKCYNCDQFAGHEARDCPHPPKHGGSQTAEQKRIPPPPPPATQ